MALISDETDQFNCSINNGSSVSLLNGKHCAKNFKEFFEKLKSKMTQITDSRDEGVKMITELESIFMNSIPSSSGLANGIGIDESLTCDVSPPLCNGKLKSPPLSPVFTRPSQRSPGSASASAKDSASTSHCVAKPKRQMGRQSQRAVVTTANSEDNLVNGHNNKPPFRSVFSERTRRLMELLSDERRRRVDTPSSTPPVAEPSSMMTSCRYYNRRDSESSNSRSCAPYNSAGLINGALNFIDANLTTSASSSNNKRGTDPYKRRYISRRKRRDLINSAEFFDIGVLTLSQMKDLAAILKSLYDDLIVQKPPFEAYYSLIVSIRCFSEKQTWHDFVEELVCELLTKHLLLSASSMAEKYLHFLQDIPLNRKLDEYKVQTLLHFHVATASKEVKLPEDRLETVASLLRMLSFMSDTKVLKEFIEDMFDNFFESSPRHLAYLYEELNQPMPSELSPFVSLIYGDPSLPGGVTLQSWGCNNLDSSALYEPFVVPSPVKKPPPQQQQRRGIAMSTSQSGLGDFEESDDEEERSNVSSASASQNSRSFKRSRSLMENKHHRMITISASGAKKLKLNNKDNNAPKNQRKILTQPSNDGSEAVDFTETVRKMRQPMRRSLTFESVTSSAKTVTNKKLAATPKGKGNKSEGRLAPETPTFHQIPDSEKRRRKLVKMAKKKVVVNETPLKFQFERIPIRQSPREHASTRSLYSCAPKPLSHLVTKSLGGSSNQQNQSIIESSDQESIIEQNDNNVSPTSPAFIRLQRPTRNVSASKSSTDKKGNFTPNSLEKTPSRKQRGTPAKKNHQPVDYVYNDDEILPPTTRKSASKTRKSLICPQIVKSTTPRKKFTRNLSQTFAAVADNSKNMNFVKSPQRKKEPPQESLESKNRRTISPKTQLLFDYNLPKNVISNYARYMSSIKRERTKPGDDLFYARESCRSSVFEENSPPEKSIASEKPKRKSTTTSNHSSPSPSSQSVAPKSRSGRIMKTGSVGLIHSANFLLNVNNKKQNDPKTLRQLHRQIDSPIRLNKRLRLAPKGSRKRTLAAAQNYNMAFASTSATNTTESSLMGDDAAQSLTFGDLPMTPIKIENGDSMMSPVK